MSQGDGKYPGNELDLFAEAKNWKRYWSSLVDPYLKGRVLEVGAGTGNNVSLLKHSSARVTEWTALEPDGALSARIPSLPKLKVITGDLSVIPGGERFQTILYLDVLEHIEDDASEVLRAANLLEPGGHLVVLAPAHQWLFSEFDRSIGHFRRYNRKSLKAVFPKDQFRQISLDYLDGAGILASLANRLLTKKSLPTIQDIRIWDRFLVPVSRMLDPLTAHRMGKSILGVWEKRL